MPQTSLEFTPGDIVRLTAAMDGNATDVSWRWVPPAGSSAPASTTNVLEWTTGANDAGVYDVEVTSPTASDSPGYGVMLLKLPPAPVTDEDAAAVLSNVIDKRGGVVTQPVQDAYTRHVIRLKQKGLWDGGQGEVFCYFSGVTGDTSGNGKLLAQSSWIRKDALFDNWDFFNMVDADHDPLNGVKGDGISKHGIMTRQTSLHGNMSWLLFTTEQEPGTNRGLWGYQITAVPMGPEAMVTTGCTRNAEGAIGHHVQSLFGQPPGEAVSSPVFIGFAGYGATRQASAPESLTIASAEGVFTVANARAADGWVSPTEGAGVFALADVSSTASAFDASRIFLIWCRPNDMTPFTGQQMSDFITEVQQYYSELQAALAPARARAANGRFLGDDPATPQNEAWVVP